MNLSSVAADSKSASSFALNSSLRTALLSAYQDFEHTGKSPVVNFTLTLGGEEVRTAIEAVRVLSPIFQAEMEVEEAGKIARKAATRPSLKHFRGTVLSGNEPARDYIAFSLLDDGRGSEKLNGVLSLVGKGGYSLQAESAGSSLQGKILPLEDGALDNLEDTLDLNLPPPPSVSGPQLRNPSPAILELAVDADQTFVQLVGAANAQARVETLVNLMNPKFQALGLAIQLTYLHMWTTPDPFNQYDSQLRLNSFMSYWQQNFTHIPRDHAHLISARSSNMAGQSVLNSTCFAYSHSREMLSSLTATIFAHEIGHTLGAIHPPSCWANGINDIMCASSNYGIEATNFGLAAQSNIGVTLGWRPACFYTQGGAPYISSSPTNVTVDAGQRALFGVAAQGGANGTYQYQWQRNEIDIPGATTQLYTIQAATMADNGAKFRVRISNAVGQVTSSEAQLTVRAASITYRADFNNDGALSVDDLFLYLNAWFQQSSSADFNFDLAISIDDLFLFLNAWFAQTTY